MRRATELFVRVSLVLVATAGTSLGADKHWLPDLEWQTGSNWVDNLLPDADSSVIFPELTWHTVGLPNSGNLEVAKIYLPKEGSLALGSDAVLAFTEVKKPEKFVQWAKKGLFLWVDPDNWDGYTDATPHADRIPCKNDVVVLPSKNRSVSISLPHADIEVAAVRLADEKKPLSRWEWRELANQEREIIGSRLTVTYAYESECANCACHSNNDLDSEVCSYMWQGDKCGPAACEDPLKVEGHCCAFCGGRLGLSNKVSAREVEPRVNEALENWRGVISWHVRNTWDGETEVLIAEKGEYAGINSQEAIDVLSKALTGAGFEILASQATGSALTDDSQMKYILGPLLGIPVILLLLLLVAFPYYGYSYTQVFSAFTAAREATPSKRKPSSGGTFGFARFKNVAEGDVDLDANIAAEVADPEEEDSDVDRPSSSSKQFENPLYKSMRHMEKSKAVVEEKMIDIDAPLSLAALESKIQKDDIDEL